MIFFPFVYPKFTWKTNERKTAKSSGKWVITFPAFVSCDILNIPVFNGYIFAVKYNARFTKAVAYLWVLIERDGLWYIDVCVGRENSLQGYINQFVNSYFYGLAW